MDDPRPAYRRLQLAGLLLGPVLFTAISVLPAPAGLSAAGWAAPSVAVLMAVWWATEALPLAATALLPLVLFPLLGVLDVHETAAPFANPLIFLFLGGFLIALAAQRWGLHRRIALHIVLRIGQRPRNLVAGAMLATAGLSMWISNTATTMMMLPIAVSLIAVSSRDRESGDAGDANFATAMMLGIAYAASIGGNMSVRLYGYYLNEPESFRFIKVPQDRMLNALQNERLDNLVRARVIGDDDFPILLWATHYLNKEEVNAFADRIVTDLSVPDGTDFDVREFVALNSNPAMFSIYFRHRMPSAYLVIVNR